MLALEFEDIMRLAKANLPDRQFKVYGLYHYGKFVSGSPDAEPMTQYTIAKRLNVSLSTVEKDLRRAREAMKPVIDARIRETVTIHARPPADTPGRFKVTCQFGHTSVEMTDRTARDAHKNMSTRRIEEILDE